MQNLTLRVQLQPQKNTKCRPWHQSLSPPPPPPPSRMLRLVPAPAADLAGVIAVNDKHECLQGLWVRWGTVSCLAQWVMSKLFSLGGSTTDSVPAGRSGEEGGALSSIAAERMVGSGRDQAHSMRQSTGTTMACVTWRFVPRGTCHVPPREPLRKQSLGQNFRRGGRRDPKLAGYMRPGMAHVPCK